MSKYKKNYPNLFSFAIITLSIVCIIQAFMLDEQSKQIDGIRGDLNLLTNHLDLKFVDTFTCEQVEPGTSINIGWMRTIQEKGTLQPEPICDYKYNEWIITSDVYIEYVEEE